MSHDFQEEEFLKFSLLHDLQEEKEEEEEKINFQENSRCFY